MLTPQTNRWRLPQESRPHPTLQSVLNTLKTTLYSLDSERAKKLIEQFIHPPSNLNFALNGRGVYFISNQCNLQCTYCKGLSPGFQAPNVEEFDEVLREWHARSLKYLHLTGLEPTVCPCILDYLKIAQKYHFEVSMSTNGYADFECYLELVQHGLKYLSISLDAHNDAIVSQMGGGREDIYARVSANIRGLVALKQRYDLKVVICLAITKLNFPMLPEIVADFLANLRPDDIRLIPVAQEQFTPEEQDYYHRVIQPQLLRLASSNYPFLRYRINNFFDVRGLGTSDVERCYVALDERTVGGQYLYPCNIYIRERGQPIAAVSDPDKNEKIWRWFLQHNCQHDPICRKYCCDVTREYNLMIHRCLHDLRTYPLFQPPVLLESILQEPPIQRTFQQLQRREFLPLASHLTRSALNAGYLGQQLDWHFLTVYYAMRAALLHDIGKSHAAIRHLAGQHPLLPHHKQLVRQHIVYGKEVLEQLGYPVEGRVALQHHERIDGSGYQRLRLNWPMAELVALSDVYTALTEERYGRTRFSSFDSVQMIRAGECGPFRGMYMTALQQCHDNKLLC